MAVSIYDIGYFPKNYLNYLSQRRLGTGMPIRPEDVQAIAEADLNARYADIAKRRALDIQEKGMENTYNLGLQNVAAENARTKMYGNIANKEQQTGLISNLMQLPMSGIIGYKIGKDMGWWGRTTKPQTPIPPTGNISGPIEGMAYEAPPMYEGMAYEAPPMYEGMAYEAPPM